MVLDCAGKNAHLGASFGHVELTRSGVAAYQDARGPVVVVDMSDLKLLETVFGTGDSYFRALEYLGVDATEGPVLIFGVGRSARALRMRRHNEPSRRSLLISQGPDFASLIRL